MTAAPRSFSHPKPVSSLQVKPRMGPTQMSLTKVFDPRSFKAFFKDRFAEFLHDNYDNAEEVAVIYGVRYQTALNWWQGINAPSGDTTTLACLRHGQKFIDFMGKGA
ncbi:hypothetical protein ACFQDZ_00640 [Sulfitobacter pacificus]